MICEHVSRIPRNSMWYHVYNIMWYPCLSNPTKTINGCLISFHGLLIMELIMKISMEFGSWNRKNTLVWWSWIMGCWWSPTMTHECLDWPIYAQWPVYVYDVYVDTQSLDFDDFNIFEKYLRRFQVWTNIVLFYSVRIRSIKTMNIAT